MKKMRQADRYLILLLFFEKTLYYVKASDQRLTQWTHFRRFAIDSTSKFHMENLLRFHRF